MPNGDKTGPDGKGPSTGRGLGKAFGNDKGRGKGNPIPKNNGTGRGNGGGNTRRTGNR